MRVWKIMVITFLLVAFGLLNFGCSGTEETGEPENQGVTVERGNLTIDITASGNLALSLTDDLVFEVAGTVEEVLVEEGDSVVEGQVLVRLDTTSLEQVVTAKDQAGETAWLSLMTAEIDLVKATDDARTSVTTAGIELEKATDDYRKITYPYTYSTWTLDIPASTALIEDARREVGEALDIIEAMEQSLESYNVGTEDYQEAWESLKAAEDDLTNAYEMLFRGTGSDLFASGILPIRDYWTLKAVEQTMEKAKLSLEKTEYTARTNVDKAEVALERARVSLEKAKDEMDIARDEMEKAVIVAPFAGFITTVNVDGGDEVKKGTVAMQLADSDKFEAEVLVGETDIMQVKQGGEAWVEVDVMPGISLPAEVTHISPTATIQSGVVNYKVTVEVQSLETAMQERQEARQQARPDISAGEMPEPLKQAVEEGRITQEQAEAMMSRRQQGEGLPLPPGQMPQGGQLAPGGQIAQTTPADFQLREGLTVIVSIVVDERHDVLLVPNQAIAREGGQTLVQVMKDGVIEPRPIEVGISDWQFTEVTGGLSEGDVVVVTGASGTTVATPSESGQQSDRKMPFPGMGGMR